MNTEQLKDIIGRCYRWYKDPETEDVGKLMESCRSVADSNDFLEGKSEEEMNQEEELRIVNHIETYAGRQLHQQSEHPTKFRIYHIASSMHQQNLPTLWIMQVLRASVDFYGIRELMAMWHEEDDPLERKQTLIAINDLLGDCEDLFGEEPYDLFHGHEPRHGMDTEVFVDECPDIVSAYDDNDEMMYTSNGEGDNWTFLPYFISNTSNNS